LVDLTSTLADSPADDQLVGYEANITPSQRDQLAAPQSGVCGHANQLGILGRARRRLALAELAGPALAVSTGSQWPGQCLDLLRRVEASGAPCGSARRSA
jgi:hypothetical protein